MSASLVGSEMCIRDRSPWPPRSTKITPGRPGCRRTASGETVPFQVAWKALLDCSTCIDAGPSARR
eukprot:15297595-Alexandrium_andersonii.AAC.1